MKTHVSLGPCRRRRLRVLFRDKKGSDRDTLAVSELTSFGVSGVVCRISLAGGISLRLFISHLSRSRESYVALSLRRQVACVEFLPGGVSRVFSYLTSFGVSGVVYRIAAAGAETVWRFAAASGVSRRLFI